MSIEHKTGNLLDFGHGITMIAHCANCQNTFGSGIALQIKEEYPLAFEADTEAAKAKKNNLGQFSVASLPNGKKIINIYAQNLFGMEKRQLDYEAFYIAFEELHRLLLEAKEKGRIHVLGIPKNIGCFRAGGSWKIVMAMLEEIFLDSPIKLIIVEYVKKEAKEDAAQNYKDRK
jgi:O-acetyl-ADP-ribose deacetylase (regulator of RNase III)